MYVKIDGQFKSIKGIERTSDSTTILVQIETETRKEEVYNYPSESPNYYHSRIFLHSDLYVRSDIVCGNKDFRI